MDDKEFLRLLYEVGYPNWQPKVGDRVRERVTRDTGRIIRVAENHRGRMLVVVEMDFPEVALCHEWVATADTWVREPDGELSERSLAIEQGREE